MIDFVEIVENMFNIEMFNDFLTFLVSALLITSTVNFVKAGVKI